MKFLKFLIDESIEYRLVNFLRSLSFNTVSVVKLSSGLENKKILSIANKENKIIITNDKDFVELIFKLQFPHKGIILFRLTKENYSAKEKKLKFILKKFKNKLPYCFTIITDKKIRFSKI